MAVRDLALTVLELEPNEFHWVMMEAVQAETEDCLGYRPVDSSTRGYADYSEALVQGAIAIRAAQGLATFDLGFHPEGILARAARPPAPARSRRGAGGSGGTATTLPPMSLDAAGGARSPGARSKRGSGASAHAGLRSRGDAAVHAAHGAVGAGCLMTTVPALL